MNSNLDKNTATDSPDLYWFYRIFGFPTKGYFTHKNAIWYYKKANGLIDIYSIHKDKLQFYHTISLATLASYLNGRKKVFSSLDQVAL